MNVAYKILKHCATGIDGETYDYVRVCTVAGAFALVAFTGYHLYAHAAFDPLSFGAAYGALLGGSAAGIAMKAKTEPGQ